jgi:hypothetical protein
MGTCTYCGTKFPLTRSTRKYCTPRCRTNACLDRKPRRIRAADVDAILQLIDSEVDSAEMLRARLRAILIPGSPQVPLEIESGRAFIPRMD